MIFASEKVSAQWDTWCYYHQGTYYAYYLITETSNGEGFGVATSSDGINWTDHGWSIRASDKMVKYLGTGSVWPDPCNQGRFICNYSEHRLDADNKPRQKILFAWSDDLINWTKFGDDYIFEIDQNNYERYGRWDCINAIKQADGSFLGTWTATPLGRTDTNGGIGFGKSKDGLHWEALPAQTIENSPDESGALTVSEDKVHAMFGVICSTGSGMYAYTADAITGEYQLAKKNTCLLKAWHTYFSRTFETPDAILVNHHAMNGIKNDKGRAITYLAPFKKFTVDEEGTQRWLWWHGNDELKAAKLAFGSICNLQNGVVLQALSKTENVNIDLEFEVDEIKYSIKIMTDGKCEVLRYDNQANNWVIIQTADRNLAFKGKLELKVLARLGMLEFYLNDYFMECCDLGCATGSQFKVGKSNLDNWEKIELWHMLLN